MKDYCNGSALKYTSYGEIHVFSIIYETACESRNLKDTQL